MSLVHPPLGNHPLNLDHLTRPPFNLDTAGLGWVRMTYDSLALPDRVAQLFVLISMGDNPDDLDRLKAFKPGGITRFFGPDIAAEHDRLTGLQARAAIPMRVSADLEG